MPTVFSPSPWKVSKKGTQWVIVGSANDVVARLEGDANTKRMHS